MRFYTKEKSLQFEHIPYTEDLVDLALKEVTMLLKIALCGSLYSVAQRKKNNSVNSCSRVWSKQFDTQKTSKLYYYFFNVDQCISWKFIAPQSFSASIILARVTYFIRVSLSPCYFQCLLASTLKYQDTSFWISKKTLIFKRHICGNTE